MTNPIITEDHDLEVVIIEQPGTAEVVTVQIPGLRGPSGAKGDQGLPGQSNVLTIGTVTTGAVGSNASATISGVSPSQTLNLTIPRGDVGATGPANVLTVGTINTGNPGTDAVVTITGTAPNQILNMTIPRGDTGITGTLRRATAASWTSTNPTLIAGEVGFETDTRYMKVGDGATVWTALNYINHPDLATATSSANNNAIAKRDGTGGFAVKWLNVTNAPNLGLDATNKTYVDGGLATKAATTLTITAGTGLTGGGDLSANRTLAVSYGSTAGTAVQGNDARVTADQIAGTASIRTLGTGAQQAAAGNHTHNEFGLQPINFQSGTSYTPVLADANREVDLSNAATIAFTVPTNAAVAFPVGTTLKIVQFGAGQINFSGASGVTVNVPPGYNASSMGTTATVYIRKRDTDHWILSGQLTVNPTAGAHLTSKTYVDGTTKTASQISDSTTVGRSVLTAADAAAARTAIGAGTSSLAIGTTGTTAAAGNHTHTAEFNRITALEAKPGILVLAPGAPVPGGTPANTVIFRTA